MTIKDVTFTRAAGEDETIDIPGNVVRCTSASAPFTIQPIGGGNGGRAVVMESGMKFVFPEKFQRLRVLSPSNQTITLYIGEGDIDDSRLSGTVNTKSTITDASSLANVTVLGTNTTVFSADSDRKFAIAYFDAGGTGRIHFEFGGGPLTTKGVPLFPGDTRTFTTTEQINGIATVSGQVLWLEEGS